MKWPYKEYVQSKKKLNVKWKWKLKFKHSDRLIERMWIYWMFCHHMVRYQDPIQWNRFSDACNHGTNQISIVGYKWFGPCFMPLFFPLIHSANHSYWFAVSLHFAKKNISNDRCLMLRISSIFGFHSRRITSIETWYEKIMQFLWIFLYSHLDFFDDTLRSRVRV